jgi:hypothetical protein
MTKRRGKRLPPRGTRCDMGTGWAPDHSGKPVISMCSEPATVTVINDAAPLGTLREVWVCEIHAQQLLTEEPTHD